MTRCLRDKTLLLLSAEGGNSVQRLHLESCKSCGERYQRMTEELELITSTLRQGPPRDEQNGRPIPILYRAAPVIAAVLFAVVLIWGEGRFLHRNFPKSSEQLASGDWSQLLEQVSEALFPVEALGQTDAAPAVSDWVSFENALHESCPADCQELFSHIATEPSAAPKKLNVQPEMERVLAHESK